MKSLLKLNREYSICINNNINFFIIEYKFIKGWRYTNDFKFSNAMVQATVPTTSYDDLVLADGNNYAYRIYHPGVEDKLYFYHNDHLMTPLFMTDSTGNIVWQANYYPFGKIYSETGTVENNLRFPGQYAESFDQRLYYNFFRYYNAQIGRYIRTDPLKLIRNFSKNVYIYSFNRPITLFDPAGLWPCKKCDYCPEGHWVINDVYAGADIIIGGGEIEWNVTIRCTSHPDGNIWAITRPPIKAKIKCIFAGINVGAGAGLNTGSITKKCNINEIFNDVWTGFSGNFLYWGSMIAKSKSGSLMLLVGTAYSKGAGLGKVTCSVHKR